MSNGSFCNFVLFGYFYFLGDSHNCGFYTPKEGVFGCSKSGGVGQLYLNLCTNSVEIGHNTASKHISLFSSVRINAITHTDEIINVFKLDGDQPSIHRSKDRGFFPFHKT
jgi:hypothetical protein